MTRLLDLGIDHIRNIIMDMAKLSENSVFTAIESYEKGVDVKTQIFEWSEMILLSVAALQSRDKDAASKLYEMDDTVDELYWKYLRKAITPSRNEEVENNLEKTKVMTRRCHMSALLILKYLERISDHACYV